jgi:DNA-binding CsgD family transcriptional regulator
MPLEESVWELTPLVYDTALRSDAWSEFGMAVGRLFRASVCGVAEHNFNSQEGSFQFSFGVPEEFRASYETRYSSLDVWLRRESAHRIPGTVHVGQHLVSDLELLSSEFYHDWLKPQNLLHRLSTVLVREEAHLCYFAMLRPPGDKPFGPEEVRALRRLAPHLRRAVQLRGRLALLEGEREAAMEVLHHLPTGVVLCEEDGSPVIVNELGKQLLSTGGALTVRGGRLSANSQADTEQLQRLISAAASGTGDYASDSGGTLSVPRCRSGLRPISVVVLPVRVPPEIPRHSRIVAAVFISDPDSVVEGNEARLSHLYGLTRAESRLAAKLAQGRSLEEAAGMLNITIETARSYSKRVLSKTGAKRQSELVRLLLLGPAYVS